MITTLQSVQRLKSIKKAIATATQTDRGNNKHQASLCLVCDRLIIDIERIHALSKERFIMHKHRLSVEVYEGLPSPIAS